MTDTSVRDVVAAARERRYRLLVGGELRDAADGATMPAFDPSTGEAVAWVPRAGAADVAHAVEAARRAQPGWAALTIRQRRDCYDRLIAAIAPHREELAALDAVNAGNPLPAMRADVDIAIEQLRDWPALALSLSGQTLPASEHLHYTAYRPYGVVGRIVPFNHPALFAMSALGAALMAGNSVVLKAADQTPLSALRLGEIVRDVLPPGVLNILSGGPDAGEAVVAHPAVKRIAFTGSTDVGRLIQQLAAQTGVKHVSLELGGKNPLIVFPDADLESAVDGAMRGMNFSVSQGQSCGSTSRILVHASLHDEFVDRMRARMEALRVGPAYVPGVDMGPVISEKQLKRVMGYIDAGRSAGAKLVTGGGRPAGVGPRGHFVAPTLFADVSPDMAIAKEEIFGPVVSVLSWTDYDTMIEQANDVEFGLAASVWTDDLHLAHKTADLLQAGYVWVNDAGRHHWGMPFGGMKNSGTGREESTHELLSYLELQSVNVVMTSPRARLAELAQEAPTR